MKRLAFALTLLTAAPAFAFTIELSDDDYVVRWPQDDVPLLLDADGTTDITNAPCAARFRRGTTSTATAW
jgi:hypothetical protein